MVLHSNRSQALDMQQHLQETARKSYQELLGFLANIPDSVRTLRDELQTQAADPSCSFVFSRMAALRADMASCNDIAQRLKDETAPDHRTFPEIAKLPYGGSLLTRRGTVHDHLLSRPSIIDGRRLITEEGVRLVSTLNAAFNQHHSLATDLNQDFSYMAEALTRHIHQAGDPPTQLSDQQKSELLDILTRIEQNTDQHRRQIESARTCPLPHL